MCGSALGNVLKISMAHDLRDIDSVRSFVDDAPHQEVPNISVRLVSPRFSQMAAAEIPLHISYARAVEVLIRCGVVCYLYDLFRS